jgi:hypothetical protein
VRSLRLDYVGSVLVTSEQERSGQLGPVHTKLIQLISMWLGPREIPCSGQVR